MDNFSKNTKNNGSNYLDLEEFELEFDAYLDLKGMLTSMYVVKAQLGLKPTSSDILHDAYEAFPSCENELFLTETTKDKIMDEASRYFHEELKIDPYSP